MALVGSCLCGSVSFTVVGDAGPVTACHCGQCRKYSGHFAASFDVADVEFASDATLHWFVHPSGAKRGFCSTCGSSLIFADAQGVLSVEAGAIDGPTGHRLTRHIHLADKGDYYDITDGITQKEQG